MLLKSLLEVLVAAFALIWIIRRQLRWQPVHVESMWRCPLVFALLAAISLTTTDIGVSLMDVGMIALIGAIAAGAGAVIGFLTQLRPAEKTNTSSLAPPREQPWDEPIRSDSRTGRLGLLPWFGAVTASVVLGVTARDLGLELASATGVIFIVIGLTTEVSNLIIGGRVKRLDTARGCSPSAGKPHAV